MIVIGVDPHKETHTATAVDQITNTDLGSIRIRSTLDDYTRLMVWALQWPKRRWAVENARGLGHHLALWLVNEGGDVVDVPSTSTARVRQLSRGNRRKTIASMPQLPLVWRRCRATDTPSSSRTTPMCCGFSTNAGAA